MTNTISNQNDLVAKIWFGSRELKFNYILENTAHPILMVEKGKKNFFPIDRVQYYVVYVFGMLDEL